MRVKRPNFYARQQDLSVAEAVELTCESMLRDGGLAEGTRDDLNRTKAFIGQLVELLVDKELITKEELFGRLLQGFEEKL